LRNWRTIKSNFKKQKRTLFKD